MAKAPDSLRIRRDIEGGTIPRVWLWTGPEEYLKEELFLKLLGAVLPDDLGGLNHDRFRAGQADTDWIIASLQTMPMLADRRVAFWQDIENLKKGERDLLVGYVQHSSPETVLVLTSNRGPKDSLNLRLEKAGAKSAVFWIPFANQTLRWIQMKFEERGLDCSSQVADQLLATCAGSPGEQVPLRNIAPEIEKVSLAASPQGSVSLDDLKVIAKKTGEDSLRRVTHAVGERNLPKALRALDQALLFKENAPVRIVATLAIYLKSVAQAQDLLNRGTAPAQVPRTAGIWPKEWDGIQRATRIFSAGEPRRILSDLSHADRKLKSSSTDSRLLLEETLSRICNPRGSA